MIQDDAIARRVAAVLMAEAKSGKRETVDVDDVIAALQALEDYPRDPDAFEVLLQLTLRRFVELAAR